MKIHLFVALGAALLAGAALIACETTIKVQGGKDTPIIHDTTVGVTMRAGPPATVETTPTETVPPGTCLKLTFTDGKGNVTGTAESTTGGDAVPVPAGSEDVTISPCDPKPDPDSKSKNLKPMGGGIVLDELRVADSGELFFYRTLPLDMSDGRGRFVDFTVRAADHDAADLIARHFLSAGIGEKKPIEVQTYGFAYVRVLPDASVRVSMISSAKPTALDFQWNGRHVADLRNAHVFATRGWYASTVRVPSSLVDVSRFGANNDVAFKLDTVERALELSSSVEVKL